MQRYQIKGTAMQIRETLRNDRLIVWSVSWNFSFQLSVTLQLYTHEICYPLKN